MSNEAGDWDFLTLKEACEELSLSGGRLRQLLTDEARRQQYFPGAVKRAGAWFLPRGEVEAFKALNRPPGYPFGKQRKKPELVAEVAYAAT